MPKGLERHYGRQHLHFITFSCYRRLPFLRTARRRDLVLRALEHSRRTYRFHVVGYVVMPEHVHLLISEPEVETPSTAIKALKQSVAKRVAQACRRRSAQLGLFPDSEFHFWQHRFYDFNVWSAKKWREKLNYMHMNPVKRGLVARPEGWRWSSYRYYAFGEEGLVRISKTVPVRFPLRAVA
jgi:putative transposase